MLFDLHNDYLTARGKEKSLRKIDRLPNAKVVYVLWTTNLGAREYDVTVAAKRHRFFAIEDLGAVAVSDYDRFFTDVHPLYVSLTWNGKNCLAGGAGSDDGLSARGKEALAAAERCGIAIDLAHLNDRSFRDVLDYYRGRVLISHTAVRELYGDRRNATADMIKKVARTGGIVGIFAAAKFLSNGKCRRSDYLDHIRAAMDAADEDSVAIGTDFCGAGVYPIGLNSYTDFYRLREEMLGYGFTYNSITKIFYQNVARFFGVEEKS